MRGPGISIHRAVCMTGLGAMAPLTCLDICGMVRSYLETESAPNLAELWRVLCTALSGAFIDGLIVMAPAWVAGRILFTDHGIRRVPVPAFVPFALAAAMMAGGIMLIEAMVLVPPSSPEPAIFFPCLLANWIGTAVVPLAMLWIPVERVIGPGDPGLAHDPFHLVPLVPAVLTSFIFTATATLVYDRDVSAIPPWAVLAAWLAIAVLPYVPLAVLRLNPGDIALLRTPIPPSRVNVRLLVLVWILLLLATAFWVDYWFGFHGRFARTPLFKCAWWACQGEITGLILITFQVIGSFMAAWFIAKFLAQPTNTVPAKTPAPSARPGVGDEATVTSPD